jgi:ribosomal protein S18 acetylase RimI-like enzyme
VTSALRIAPLSPAELPDVVALHGRAFPDAALTAFGPEALRRYYAWLLEGPHDAVLAGAWQDDTLVGFCAAGVFRGAMSGFLRKNRAYLAAHVLRHPRLALSPLIRDRIAAASGPRPAPSFGILSIATDPRIRGAGVGRALMAEAEGRARRSGHLRMTLTVHPTNARAVRFYEQLGWTRAEPWTGAMTRELA